VSILGFGDEKTAIVLNYDCGKKESSGCSAEALLRSESFIISVLVSTDRRVFRKNGQQAIITHILICHHQIYMHITEAGEIIYLYNFIYLYGSE